MRCTRLIPAVALLGLALAAPAVQAAGCSFGSSGSEASLQNRFDYLLGANAPTVTSDCLTEGTDARWQIADGSSGGATILIELAGYANDNRFGIYDPLHPGTRLQLFSGGNDPGDSRSFTVTPVSGGFKMQVGGSSAIFASAVFGFFLQTPQDGSSTYYSESSRNSDGADHMYAYQGDGSTFLKYPVKDKIFGTNDYILAWEDLKGLGDKDFQDFVVVVKNVAPVPLPPAAWLMLSGLAGLAAIGRRRRSVAAAPRR
jgi:hypothetical protein